MYLVIRRNKNLIVLIGFHSNVFHDFKLKAVISFPSYKSCENLSSILVVFKD